MPILIWCYCKPLASRVVNVCQTSLISIVFVSFYEVIYVWCPSSQRGFWWYQVSLVNWFLLYVFWQYKLFFPDNRNEHVMKIEMNQPLEAHEKIVGNSWALLSMVASIFYGAIVVLSGDVVNSIFRIILMIFVKGLPRDLCDLFYFIATGLN